MVALFGRVELESGQKYTRPECSDKRTKCTYMTMYHDPVMALKYSVNHLHVYS